MSANIQSEKRNETILLKWLNDGNIESTYTFYFPYVAAAVSLVMCTTEKEMIRRASKTKRCKRNCVLFNLQKNGRCKRTAE
jgi:hypothetical protein